MSNLQIVPLKPASPAILLSMYPGAECGWPSPALDWSEAELSLDELVGVGSTTTWLAWVTDGALANSGICQDDILVVDTALQPIPGDIVLALHDGEHFLRRLSEHGQQPALMADTPGISPLMIGDEQELLIQGVCTYNLHRHPGASASPNVERDAPACLDDVIKIGQCSTFLVRARGDSMRGAGIRSGDVLVVDRACDPKPGYVVVAIVDGEFTVKRLGTGAGGPVLSSENDLFPIMPLLAKDNPALWGTVVWNLQRIARR
ncbi:S24 family peptidase [Pseudomonas baetica]|uniref:S24 family peptidase n=1 Tax=Pseudomonas baetica TaxID=674054 RepID=UPI002407195B|nr:S24 family peptidase [Pseudomonas baetica]MDF9778757.1 DNA polymerase V [Pseudomonas baetica]